MIYEGRGREGRVGNVVTGACADFAGPVPPGVLATNVVSNGSGKHTDTGQYYQLRTYVSRRWSQAWKRIQGIN